MSVVYPTKYKTELADEGNRKILPVWSMTKDLNNGPLELDELKPPSPYPPNRRKPGVTLPTAGRILFKIMQTEKCPDIQKEAVKCLQEVEPLAIAKNGNGKNKKGKKK